MRTSSFQTQQIVTPEGVSFSLILATPLTRFSAWVIDFSAIAAIVIVLNSALGILQFFSKDLQQALGIISYFVISIGYGIWFEWSWRGQTVGKRLLRLRVVDEHGLPLQINQIIIRNLLRCVDMLPCFYLVGGVACLLGKKVQRLGDYAANTLVTRTPPSQEVDFTQVMSGQFNSFLLYPHLGGRLRKTVDPVTARIALQALLRRNELTPSARIELFARLAAHFQKEVEFPEEVTLGLTPEQYVRNIVDIIYHKRTKFRPNANKDIQEKDPSDKNNLSPNLP
jgi:uncharacterized RDD family membrane protein YckC